MISFFIQQQYKILNQYIKLTKPKVTQLAIYCSIIGMFLSVPGFPNAVRFFAGIIGIWLLASSAFAINCLIEKKIDIQMHRTAYRSFIFNNISNMKVIVLSCAFSGLGICILYNFVNVLTMWLTLATFFGYVFIYTLILKPITPQNIVIGGLSGAMPPALGWTSISGSLSAEAWILVLIIFVWTPPHFWSLALYRNHDYIKTGLPMLPVTHGINFTSLHIFLYSIILLISSSLLPYIVGMSGIFYLLISISLGTIFVFYAWKLYKFHSIALAKKLFHFSILYLSLLFSTLLLDHWIHII
ncbi:MAG: protoheme IX farnesyltransferase [Bordetella sp.]|nr:MAG: protoheme IX farnesyltransferase [Bordetella sp.]